MLRCTDVVSAVNFARENEPLVAVRGGGHNVSGRALCDDGIVIDLSGMKGIHVDAKNRTARVQGGATLGDLDRETHVFGLAVPAGLISKTGIAGLTLGGGVGWLVRKYGLTCDNVLSFDIVTADGKPRVASANENEDLFWALGGGWQLRSSHFIRIPCPSGEHRSWGLGHLSEGPCGGSSPILS